MPKDTGKYPTPIVEEISRLNISGNVVPREWLIKLKMPNGAPDPISALVLAEIIFWYRWTEVRDPATQVILHRERRFKADKLQKSYQQLSKSLGFSKQQVRDAIERLEAGGYITKELRSFFSSGGTWIANAMFLEPVPIAIDILTFAPIEAKEIPLDDEAFIDDESATDALTYGPQTTPRGPQTTPSPSTDQTYT